MQLVTLSCEFVPVAPDGPPHFIEADFGIRMIKAHNENGADSEFLS